MLPIQITTVESWTDPDKGPVKAIYSAGDNVVRMKAEYVFSPDKVEITTYTEKAAFHKTVKLRQGVPVVLSQFNPFTVMGPAKESGDIDVFDPETAAVVTQRIKALMEPAGNDAERVFRVSSGDAWSEIATSSQGDFRSLLNSRNQEMRVTEMTSDELDFLSLIASRIGAKAK
jgi:hypothetical protein